MDINLPPDAFNLSSPLRAQGDLLGLLRRAGTIEAEVVKVLQDNLLLRTRLGEILTRNTLNYKTGDRINLRLDESGRAPVLKSSPSTPAPTTFEIRNLPDLARLLPPQQPLLAKVIQVVARQPEILLARTPIKLPREVNAARGDLLRLVRNDSRRQIEITPLQPKAIYKALLTQLIPASGADARTSLVSLMNLLRAAAGDSTKPRTESATRPARAAVRQPLPAVPTARPGPAPAETPDIPAASNRNLSEAAAIRPQRVSARRADGAPPPSPAAARPAATAPSVAAAPPLVSTPTTSANRTAAAAYTPDPAAASAANAAAKTNPVPAPGGRGDALTEPGAGSVERRPRIQGNQAPAASSRPPDMTAATTTRATTGTTNPAPAAPPSRPAPPPAAPLTAAPAISPPGKGASEPYPPSDAATGVASGFGRETSSPGPRSETAPLLKMLARLVLDLAQTDAASLKRWFQAAGLVSGKNAPASPGGDSLALLNRLRDGEAFSRELGQLSTPAAKTASETDSVSSRALLETLAPLVREGQKLVEQSLTQNLLQRATLGLQQETQQPLALNLALPLLDQNEIKPLHIELAQRRAAPTQDDSCWEIRIGFEFSELGPVSCHIVLEGEAVAASFYSERAGTRASIDAALPQLRQQLTRAGFETGELHSFSGGIKIDASPPPHDFGEALIDIEV